MMLLNDEFFGKRIISDKAYVSSYAFILGEVIIEDNVIVAPHASLRADEGAPFRICKGVNIQDGVIMHGLLDRFVEIDGEQYSIYIGSHCSLAHGAIVHGPTKIGKKTFVGFRAIVHNSNIGRNCYIGHGSQVIGVTIGDNRTVPEGAIITVQQQADLLPSISEAQKHFNHDVVDYNKALVPIYAARRKKKQEKEQSVNRG
jgi:carbonic anhydrase/acetyltransferase-like protein (isoleucine patch superfamily)